MAIDESKHPCWGCGAPAPGPNQKPFQQCQLCVEKKYAVCCRFCSKQCMATHYVRHVEWHAQKDAAVESVTTSNQEDLDSWRLQAAELWGT